MEEYIPTNIRLTVKQYERLRKESFDTKKSQAEIVREALEMRWAQKEKEVTKMTGEIYKIITVNGKQVKCIDEIDGFSLEIDGQKYHVYVDADGNTNVDQVMGDEREYIGMINDLWTGDEEEAAKFILS